MNKTKEISRLEELLDNSDSSKTEVIDVIMDISRKMRLPYHIKDLEKLLPEQQHAIVYDDIMQDITAVIKSAEPGEYTDEENEEFKQERLDNDEYELAVIDGDKFVVKEATLSDRIMGRTITEFDIGEIDYDQFISNISDILKEKLTDKDGNMYSMEHEYWNLVENFKFRNEMENKFGPTITNDNIKEIATGFAKEKEVVENGIQAKEGANNLEENNIDKENRDLEEI